MHLRHFLSASFAFLFAMILTVRASAQKVGVVLSGGGATAAAHVGFLKALEEEEIPIDYITGTSMGALIGALYATGYSANEIDSIVQSENYVNMSKGILSEEFIYYFKNNDPVASMGTLKFSKGSFISSTIPTNLIDPVVIDYDFMEVFAPPSAAANYDFDSLFVPFRCPASDIESKKEIVFRNGQLGMAVRASMTYPFYLKPIRVDGKLMFDGGLYNNYPANIMYNDFLPDVIIGCNVSENEMPPEEDDLLSMLKNMILYKTNFENACEQTVLVEPQSDVGTFDFDKMGEAIRDGYQATKSQIPAIKEVISSRRSAEELAKCREVFRKKMPPLVFDEISISGLDKSQKSYVNKILGKGQDSITSADLKDRYFRVFGDDKIKSIYPTATYQTVNNKYQLHLNVEKEKDVFLEVGGNFSSRAINTGFIGLKYNMFGKISGTLNANSYFGKYYGSVLLSSKFDFSARVPFSVEPYLIFNRWDYFRSFATFFEDVRPSFIVIDERFGGLRFRFPFKTKTRIDLESAYARIADDYYQQADFLATDTADRTMLNGVVSNFIIERSTLNRKQFASEGTFLRGRIKHLYGNERTIPGSTSVIRDTTSNLRQWVTAQVIYRNYFERVGPFKFGFHLEGVASNQPLMQNYQATVISATAFEPIPEAKTFFLESYRAQNYAAGGLIMIAEIVHNVELRAEGYVYQPFGVLRSDADDKPFYDWDLQQGYMTSGSAIFFTPIGPLSFSANYYSLKQEPWSFVLNFGYLLFNRSIRQD